VAYPLPPSRRAPHRQGPSGDVPPNLHTSLPTTPIELRPPSESSVALPYLAPLDSTVVFPLPPVGLDGEGRLAGVGVTPSLVNGGGPPWTVCHPPFPPPGGIAVRPPPPSPPLAKKGGARVCPGGKLRHQYTAFRVGPPPQTELLWGDGFQPP